MIVLLIVLAVLLKMVYTASLLTWGFDMIYMFGDVIIFALIVWILVKLFRRR